MGRGNTLTTCAHLPCRGQGGLREGLIFSNREIPIGEKPTAALRHAIFLPEVFLSVGISRQTKNTISSVISVALW